MRCFRAGVAMILARTYMLSLDTLSGADSTSNSTKPSTKPSKSYASGATENEIAK